MCVTTYNFSFICCKSSEGPDVLSGFFASTQTFFVLSGAFWQTELLCCAPKLSVKLGDTQKSCRDSEFQNECSSWVTQCSLSVRSSWALGALHHSMVCSHCCADVCVYVINPKTPASILLLTNSRPWLSQTD